MVRAPRKGEASTTTALCPTQGTRPVDTRLFLNVSIPSSNLVNMVVSVEILAHFDAMHFEKIVLLKAL